MTRMTRNARTLLCALSVLAASDSAGQDLRALIATRDLYIDAARADLTRTTQILVGRNGEMIMRQMDDGHIRIFDAQGNPFTFGRRGIGPNEFSNLREAGFVGDTLWAADISLRRITFISPSRTTIRIADYPPFLLTDAPGGPIQTSTSYPAAIYSDGTLLMHASPRPTTGTGGGVAGRGSAAAGGAGAGGATGAASGATTVVPARSGRAQVPPWALQDSLYARPLVHMSADGKFLKVIAWRPQIPDCGMQFPLSNGFGNAVIPFCAGLLESVAADGSRNAFINDMASSATTGSYRVTVIAANADTMFSRVISYRPVAIPKEKHDSVINERLATYSTRPEFVTAYRNLPLRTHYPPVRSILLGRDNTTWLELWTPAAERSWMVLDSRGNGIATLKVPSNVTLLAVQLNMVWGLETDVDGVHSVVRYRVAG